MRIITIILSALMAVAAYPQAMFFSSATQPDSGAPSQLKMILEQDTLTIEEDTVFHYASVTDSLFANVILTDTTKSLRPLPRRFFLPAVYTSYAYPDTASAFTPDYSGQPWLKPFEDMQAANARAQSLTQHAFMLNPGVTPYNIVFLPEAPKEYVAVVNPTDHTITINEVVTQKVNETTIEGMEVKKRHWVKDFSASLQFTQAYVSPNWYQGGNNNVNAMLNLYYNVKLNQKFHPNLLFENTFQYKLGINSAPDDTIRGYNVSTDILQVNTTFGVRAAKKWYYSLTGQFKTQIVNSYATNSNNLRSALLSPGELNLGLGMTYNTANAKKTFTFDASISPVSYNMVMCFNKDMNVANYGIEPGKHTVSKYGSSAECKMQWQMAYNITLRSRLFGFTDYDRAYADWENTVIFTINKFITTQLYVAFRYDTKTPPVDDPSWKKLQLKENISLGFAYNFKS